MVDVCQHPVPSLNVIVFIDLDFISEIIKKQVISYWQPASPVTNMLGSCSIASDNAIGKLCLCGLG